MELNPRILALVLFGAAGFLGVFLALANLYRRRPPLVLGLLHALPALAGLGVLIGATLAEASPPPVLLAGLGLLALAALGGMIMLLGRGRRRGSAPAALVLAHGAAATAGVALLAWVAAVTL